MLIQPQRIEDERRARRQRRVEKCQQPRAQPTSRASAGHILYLFTHIAFDDLGIVRQRRVEFGNHRGRRALLRAIDG